MIGSVFSDDPEFSREAGRLMVFVIASFVGMVAHWYKMRYRRETTMTAKDFFFKIDFYGTVAAVIGTLFFVAAAWVLGFVREGSSLNVVFIGLLCGYCSNSMFNSDGTRRSLSEMAQEALKSFQAPEVERRAVPRPEVLTKQQASVHDEEAGVTAVVSNVQVVQMVPDPANGMAADLDASRKRAEETAVQKGV